MCIPRSCVSMITAALPLALLMVPVGAEAGQGSFVHQAFRGVQSRVREWRNPHQPRTVGKALDARAKRTILKSVADARVVTEKVQLVLEAKENQTRLTDPGLRRLARFMYGTDDMKQLSRSDKGFASKADNSPVTIADFAAQAIVARGLNAAVGQARLVGEESAAALRKDPAMRKAVVAAVRLVDPNISTHEVLSAIDKGNDTGKSSDKSHWTLDPIDGTKGFLRLGQYAISLARITKGVIDYSVLAAPNLSLDTSVSPDQIHRPGLIFQAARGEGATVLPGDNIDAAPQPVKAGKGTRDHQPIITRVEGGDTKSMKDNPLGKKLYRKMVPVAMDSAAKYAAAVLHGGIYIRTSRNNKIWDHAGGVLLAEEMGFKVTDLHGKPLNFGTGPKLTENRGIIVAPRLIHNRVLRAMQKLEEEAQAKKR